MWFDTVFLRLCEVGYIKEQIKYTTGENIVVMVEPQLWQNVIERFNERVDIDGRGVCI